MMSPAARAAAMAQVFSFSIMKAVLSLFEMALILRRQSRQHFFAPVVEPLERTRRVNGEGVRSDQRQGHGRIEITNHRVRQRLRINFAPGDSLTRRGTGKPAGIRASIGDLDIIVVAFLGES